jgi:hypothetical protein
MSAGRSSKRLRATGNTRVKRWRAACPQASGQIAPERADLLAALLANLDWPRSVTE